MSSTRRVKGSLRDIGMATIACDVDTQRRYKQLAGDQVLWKFMRDLSIELLEGKTPALTGQERRVSDASLSELAADMRDLRSSTSKLEAIGKALLTGFVGMGVTDASPMPTQDTQSESLNGTNDNPVVTVRDGIPMTMRDLDRIERGLTLVAMLLGIRINTRFRKTLRRALSYGMMPGPDTSAVQA